MIELQDKDMVGSTIIEHRNDGGSKVGKVEYNDLNGNGSFCIGWYHDGRNCTTVFERLSWRCEVIANVVLMHRISEDTGLSDTPWPTANLYTIVQASK